MQGLSSLSAAVKCVESPGFLKWMIRKRFENFIFCNREVYAYETDK